MVILDIGTNDLDAKHHTASFLAKQVFDVAKYLLEKHQIEKVIILEALHRSPRGRFSPSDSSYFSAAVNQYNSMLKSLVASARCEHVQIYLWHHKRMATSVHQYIADGVHLNLRGLSKYFYSLKRAIVYHS